MSNPYVGEIRMFAGNFAPNGWLLCQGQLLAIDDFDTLFNLIGTTYGGDGQTNFALPDLQSRIPLHAGTGGGDSYSLAQTGGQETVQLTTAQLPVHSHALAANTGAGTTPNPSGAVPAGWSRSGYSTAGATVAMNSTSMVATGGNQPHDNMPPYLVVNFIISLYGIYPSPT